MRTPLICCLLFLAGCQTSGSIVPGGALILPECKGVQAFLRVTTANTESLVRAPHLDGVCAPAPAASSPKIPS